MSSLPCRTRAEPAGSRKMPGCRASLQNADFPNQVQGCIEGDFHSGDFFTKTGAVVGDTQIEVRPRMDIFKASYGPTRQPFETNSFAKRGHGRN